MISHDPLSKSGAPERIRTSDPQIRSLVLYPTELRAHCRLAEREGFEPSVGFPLRRFSKPVPSATRPSLLKTICSAPGAEMAEEVGFEPTVPFGTTVFKTAALNHSATPPCKHRASACPRFSSGAPSVPRERSGCRRSVVRSNRKIILLYRPLRSRARREV